MTDRVCDREEPHAPHSWGDLEWCPGGVLEIRPDYLIREERWTPIDESGQRWTPRSKEAAMDCMESWPAGGVYSNGEPWHGVVRVVKEIRYVTEWTEESGGEAP
jgi:hypothetical protein